MRDIIISAIVAVLILCLAVFFVIEKKEDARNNANVYEAEMNTSALRAKMQSFQRELDELNRSYENQTVGASRIMLVFNEANTVFVREICPLLENRGVVGVLTLSKDNLPTDNSLLTKEKFDHLIEIGWETALYYDGEVDVELWHREEKAALDDSEISVPTTVIVPNSVYTDELYGKLYELGFVDIIVKAYQPDITRPDELGVATVTDSVGWYTVTASRIITLFASRTGDIAFTVGWGGVEEKYQGEQFEKMLDTVSHSAQKGLLFYSTPSVSREYKNKLLENNAIMSEQYEKRKAELEEEIKKLEEEIVGIYDKYLEEK